MTNFKQYFRSHLKANIKPIIYILASVLVLTFLRGINAQPTGYYDFEANKMVSDYLSTLYIPVDFICIIAYVLPVMEFSFFKKRINLDCAYSLPISRKALCTVHYLTGLIILFGAFTSSYLLNFALLLSRGAAWFNFAPMIAHYFLSLVCGYIIYSVMVFVFNEANTKGDGIWFMCLYTFVFSLVASAFDEIIKSKNIFTHTPRAATPWGILDKITANYQYLVEIESANRATFWQTPELVGWFAFWVVVGIASTIGLFLTFGKRRMERTEEISNSYFGFRVLIPVCAISGMITIDSFYIINGLILEFVALLGYTIYRRGFHYKKSDIAILCALLIFLFV